MLSRCTLLLLGVLVLSTAQWERTSFIQQPLPNSGVKERFGLVALSRSGLCGFISAPSCGSGTGCQPGTVYALNRTILGVPFSPRNGTALLTPAAAIGFGSAHAISATCSLAIVGAGQTSFSSGRAYIFLPCGTQLSGWCLSATLAVSDLGLPTFGSAVATNAEGWGVAVGARNSGSPTGGNGYGSVWFCAPPGLAVNASTWNCEKLLPTGASGDWMGSSVAISDDALTLVATLPYSRGQGAVNVWTRPPGSRAVGSGPWSLLTQLNPNSGRCNLGTSSNRNYGVALAMTGDARVIVVGAAQGGALYGAAVVFDRQPGGDYTCTTLLRPSKLAYGDAVGSSVAVTTDGNTIMVGSSMRFAFLFNRTDPSAPFVERFSGAFGSPDQKAFNEGFSQSLALSGGGSTALIGAPGSSTAQDTYKGYAVLIDAPPTPAPSPSTTPSPSPTPTPTITPSPTAPPTGSPTTSPTPTPTPSPTASLVVGASSSDTPTPTASVVKGSTSDTPTGSATGSASGTGSGTPSLPETPSPTPSLSSTPTPSLSFGSSPSCTPSPTPSTFPTSTPTTSPTPSTPTPTPTPTATPSNGSGGPPAQGNAAAAAAAAAALGGGIGGGIVGVILLSVIVALTVSHYSALATAKKQAAARLTGAGHHGGFCGGEGVGQQASAAAAPTGYIPQGGGGGGVVVVVGNPLSGRIV